MTTDTTTTTTELTADDIAAARIAETVCFTHNGILQRYGQVRGNTIRLILSDNLTDSRVWTAREQRLFPIVSETGGRERIVHVDSYIRGYAVDGIASLDWHTDSEPGAYAFEMIHSAQYDLSWVTVAHLLRKGDTLGLAWTADNNNDTIRAAGLHCDELKLHVQRPTSDRAMVFNIDRAVTLDNSARMIQRHGHR